MSSFVTSDMGNKDLFFCAICTPVLSGKRKAGHTSFYFRAYVNAWYTNGNFLWNGKTSAELLHCFVNGQKGQSRSRITHYKYTNLYRIVPHCSLDHIRSRVPLVQRSYTVRSYILEVCRSWRTHSFDHSAHLCNLLYTCTYKQSWWQCTSHGGIL